MWLEIKQDARRFHDRNLFMSSTSCYHHQSVYLYTKTPQYDAVTNHDSDQWHRLPYRWLSAPIIVESLQNSLSRALLK